MRSDPALIGALLLIAAPLYLEFVPGMALFLGCAGLVTLLVGLIIHLRGAPADDSDALGELPEQENPDLSVK